MNSISPQQLCSILKGTLVSSGKDCFITYPLLDSRIHAVAGHEAFFAIRGKNHDGHRYIPEMIEKGIQVIVGETFDHITPNDCWLIQVENSLEALQRWSAYHRSFFTAPLIAITGSNGKTIVKEWLYQILRKDFNIARSPKSYNSQVGVPLSLLLLNEQHELALIEAGISQPGEMEKLQTIIQPDIGILTNVRNAHSENFVDRKEHIREKVELFKSCKTIIYGNDDEQLDEEIRNQFPERELITFGKNKDAFLHVISQLNSGSKTKLELNSPAGNFSLDLPFTDIASIENALCCICCAIRLQIEPSIISERIAQLTPIEMRLELLNGENQCTLINDSYNSDIASLSIALDFMNQHHRKGKKTVILSDILQDKQAERELYRQVAHLLNEKKVDRLIAIGDKIKICSTFFQGSSSFYESTEAFLKEISVDDFQQETILIKGARSFGFERITQRLQEKAHETVLEIDLNALAHNLNYYRNLIPRETKIMGMVKAFSYGSGSKEVAEVLEFNRCDYLAVAYADEGVELRKAGISLPIMVMNPTERSIRQIIDFHLEPEVYSFKILHEIRDYLMQHSEIFIRVHLKIDTGMHRLGFLPEEIEQLCQELKSVPRLKVVSIFSHLAGSDDPQLDEFSLQQQHELEAAALQIELSLGYKPMKHLLNSAGIARFPNASLDMVRLGIGLYGVGSQAQEQLQLQNVSKLRSILSQIKSIPAGETVGYNRNAKLNRDSKIGIVPLGYADGFSRLLGNGNGDVIVAGKRAPVVGNVCMDMLMIDLTDIPEAAEGDDVIIFDSADRLKELAQKSHTIPYEILTSVSARVKRVYLRE